MESVIDTLKCSNCTKYLSVFPIKVYRNLLVKCGRCNSDDDGGTVSYLYQTLVEKIPFPCINRYEGCTQTFTPDEMKLHELNCVGSRLQCPLCSVYEEESFRVIEHVKQQHPKQFLKHPEFILPLDDNDEDIFYLYANSTEHIMAVISVRYDKTMKYFYLDVAVIDSKNMRKEKCLHSYELSTVYKEAVYKSPQRKCSSYDMLKSSCNGGEVCLRNSYPKDVIVCKISLQKYKTEFFKEVNMYELIPSDTRSSEHTFRFFVYDIVSSTRAYSPIFYLGNTVWRIVLNKKEDNFNEQLFLGCNVEKVDHLQENKFSYNIQAEFTLLLCSGQENAYMKTYVTDIDKGKFPDRNCGFDTLKDWNYLLNNHKNYIRANNEIEIEVTVKLTDILPHGSLCKCNGCVPNESNDNDIPFFDQLIPSATQNSMHKFRFSVYDILSLTRAYSVFYLGNTIWRIVVEKTGLLSHLSCIIEKLDHPQENKFSYKIEAKCTVLSSQNHLTRSLSSAAIIIGKRKGENISVGQMILPWNTLLNEKNGFLKDNNEIRIEAEVKLIKVLPHGSHCPCVGCY